MPREGKHALLNLSVCTFKMQQRVTVILRNVLHVTILPYVGYGWYASDKKGMSEHALLLI